MNAPDQPGDQSKKRNTRKKSSGKKPVDIHAGSEPGAADISTDSGQILDLHKLITLGVVCVNDKGIVCQANSAVAQIYNLPIDEIVGQPFVRSPYKYFHEDGSEIPDDRHPAEITLKTGKHIQNMTVGILDPVTKKYKWLLLNSFPEYLPGKEKPHQTIVTLVDVSHLKTIVETFGRYETLLNLAMVASDLGIWKQSFESQMFYLDETTRRHFGFESEYVNAAEILDRIFPEDKDRVTEEARSALEKKITNPINTEFRVLHPDGSVRWLAVNVIVQFMETESGLVPYTTVGTSHDITERKLAEEALQRKTRAFFLLSHCDQALVKISDENDLLNEICRICVEDGNYLMAWIGIVEKEDKRKIQPVAQCGFEDGYLKSVRFSRNYPTVLSIRNRQIYISQNIQQDPRYIYSREEALKRGYNSSIALPISITNQVIGVITLYSRHPDAFQQEEVSLLNNLVNDLAFTIDTIRARVRQSQLEIELQKSEDRNRLAQQAAKVGIWEWATNSETLFWSEEMYQIYDKSRDEFTPTNNSIFECIHLEDKQTIKNAINKSFSTGEPFDVEHRIYDSKGQIRWINVKGNVFFDAYKHPSLAVGTTQEITRRKQVEEELVQANEKYRLISEYSTDVIWVMDTETERFTFVSPSIKKLRGFTVEEMMQQNMTDMLTPESYQKVRNIIKNSVPDYLDGKPSTSFVLELDQYRKDGSIVSTEVTSTQAYDEQGNLQVIGITRDITERKRAEAIIREERNLFQILMDNIPDAIYFKNIKSRFIRINKAESLIFGLKDPTQAIGKTDFDFFTEEHARPARETEEQIIQTGQPMIDYEEKETYPDGHTRWISTSKLPFRNSSGEIIGTFGISHDITKRKETELALKQRVLEMETVYHLSNFIRSAETVQDLLQRLLTETLRTLNCGDGGMFLYDPETKKLVLYAAQGWFEQLAGLALNPDEGINGHVYSTNKPYFSSAMRDDKFLAQRVKEFIPAGQIGGFFPIECNEGILGVLDIFVPSSRAITENEQRLIGIITQLAGNAILRSQLTEKLKQSNINLQEEVNQRISYQALLAAEKELLSTTVMSLGEGVIITNDEGMIILFNHSAEMITGYEIQEILNKPLYTYFQILDPNTQQIIPDLIQSLGKMSHQQEQDPGYKAPMLIRKSGERILVSGSIASLNTSEGKSMGHVIVFQDVTERMKAEAQTALSQKMEALGQMAAGIAHEINTPIQYVGDNLRFLQKTIMRFTEVMDAYQNLSLAEGKSLDQEQIDNLENVKKHTKISHYLGESPNAVQESLDGVERVRKIVMAMREFSHPSEKEKKVADINHGIETTIVISRNEWKYSADLETHLDPSLPPILCQIDEINQVILNMIINAVQAIQEKNPPESGIKGKITISTCRIDNNLHIKIQDTGIGIPEEIKRRIFDPFFTTKGVGKGTGQGLSLAHQIITHKHQGKIYVDSIVGEGTTFTIELPVDVSEEGG